MDKIVVGLAAKTGTMLTGRVLSSFSLRNYSVNPVRENLAGSHKRKKFARKAAKSQSRKGAKGQRGERKTQINQIEKNGAGSLIRVP